MPVAAAKARRESGRARSTLRARLEARREEIEGALLTRTHAIADPSEAFDPAYAESLRRAVAAALEYGLQTLESGEGHDPPIPVELLAQARLAARNGISLDTVLRRYFAGYSLLGYFMIEEASRDGLISGAGLQRLVATQATRFDRLLAAIGEEHARESATRLESSGRLLAERIERLLAGELIDTSGIAYDFDGWHVGVALGAGPESERSLRGLASRLDCRLLLLPRDDGTLWAWLGARRRPDPAEIVAALPERLPADCTCALGEPGEELAGWRLTHRQATAALPIAMRGSESVVRYSDVALLASIVQDDLLTGWIRTLYLAPLEADREGGMTARKTLHAYFAAERNISSAAAALGVSRQAVRGRLCTIEERIGRPLDVCAVEIELALRLHEWEGDASQLEHVPAPPQTD